MMNNNVENGGDSGWMKDGWMIGMVGGWMDDCHWLAVGCWMTMTMELGWDICLACRALLMMNRGFGVGMGVGVGVVVGIGCAVWAWRGTGGGRKEADGEEGKRIKTMPESALFAEAAAYTESRLDSYYGCGSETRVVDVGMTDAEKARLTRVPLPEDPMDEMEALDLIRALDAHPMGNGHPRFFAWIMSAPSRLGVALEMAALGQNTPGAGVAHNANIYLQESVVRWIAELIGFPDSRWMKGLLVSGGSMANIVALGAARYAAAAKQGINVKEEGVRVLPRLRIYASKHVHSCVEKAAILLGLGAKAVVAIPFAQDGMSMDVASLRAVLEGDLEDPEVMPMAVVATAGSTNCGAVDNLDGIASLCAEHQVWMHVDGAYGGFGSLDPSKAHLFAGIERATSVAVDPHKWLQTPLDAGCVLFRDGRVAKAAFGVAADYLPPADLDPNAPAPADHEVENAFNYLPTLTAASRVAKVLGSIAELGAKGVRDMVVRHNELAAYFASLVEGHPAFELVVPVTLSVVLFRLVSGGDEANSALVARVAEQGKFFYTPTVYEGSVVQRVCVLSRHTRREDVDALFAHLVDQVANDHRVSDGSEPKGTGSE